ncbi:Hypothetical predicted protein [Cloeon dipterum]|uniref:Uncharacterized protein n=1 Tax=Cloeon dipterum TaxID=197152 RepID=A0A8S1DNF4_9INSE|nr:Hypothetical predicted protein [Cloeon dipterum]
MNFYNLIIDCASGSDLKEIVSSAVSTVFDDSIKKLLVFSKPKKCPTNPSLVKTPIEKTKINKILIAAIKQICKQSQVKYDGNKSITRLVSRNLTASSKADGRTSQQRKTKKDKKS